MDLINASFVRNLYSAILKPSRICSVLAFSFTFSPHIFFYEMCVSLQIWQEPAIPSPLYCNFLISQHEADLLLPLEVVVLKKAWCDLNGCRWHDKCIQFVLYSGQHQKRVASCKKSMLKKDIRADSIQLLDTTDFVKQPNPWNMDIR